MPWLLSLWGGLRALFHKKEVEHEMDEELRGYLDAAVRDKMRSGMSHEQALRAARVEMGSMEAVKEGVRSAAWETTIETTWRDFRYALRQLKRNPGFTAVCVLTLALGIGANTAVFSIVYAVLLRPLPFQDPGRLVMVWETGAKQHKGRVVVSPANFTDWKEQSKTLEHLTALWWSGMIVTINGEPTDIRATRVTSDFFDVLGIQPARGRAFSSEEQHHAGSRVVVISDSLWRRLGWDPNLIGKTIRIGKDTQLNGEPYTVVGIMPPGFNFPSDDDAWFPLPKEAFAGDRGWHYLQVIGKLKPDVSIAQAQSEMDTIAARLRHEYPKTNEDIGVMVVSLQEQTIGEARRALVMLLAAVGCVLLIACANVANLMLARATTRRREFALRAALGGSRRRVIRYVLGESVLLALAGGALGVAGAYLGMRAFVAFDPVKLPRIQEITVNTSMLLFTLLVAVSTGVLFGLAPALRSSSPDLNESLKDGSERHCGKPSRTFGRSLLAVVQVALSILLLTGAGLLLRSFIKRVTVPLGFRPDGVLAVELPWSINPHIDELLVRLRALPGVQSAGAATGFPNEPPHLSSGIEIEGRPATPGEELDAGITLVTPGFFRAAGMTLREGRFVAASDTANAPLVVVINEALAHRYFPGQNPIGRRTRSWGDKWCTIVGVADNVKGFGVDRDPMPNVYFSRLQADWGNPVYVLIRTAVPPSSMVGVVRKEIRSWNKNVAITKLAPEDELLADSVTVPRFYMLLVLAFAALAVTLAAVGVYGLLSYSVAHRTHEVGLRMALGAERADVLEMILRQGFILILTGVVLGLAGAWASTRFLQSMLFETNATDAATFLGASLVLIVAGLLACYLPARRATKVDPMVALRYE